MMSLPELPYNHAPKIFVHVIPVRFGNPYSEGFEFTAKALMTPFASHIHVCRMHLNSQQSKRPEPMVAVDSVDPSIPRCPIITWPSHDHFQTGSIRQCIYAFARRLC